MQVRAYARTYVAVLCEENEIDTSILRTVVNETNFSKKTTVSNSLSRCFLRLKPNPPGAQYVLRLLARLQVCSRFFKESLLVEKKTIFHLTGVSSRSSTFSKRPQASTFGSPPPLLCASSLFDIGNDTLCMLEAFYYFLSLSLLSKIRTAPPSPYRSPVESAESRS